MRVAVLYDAAGVRFPELPPGIDIAPVPDAPGYFASSDGRIWSWHKRWNPSVRLDHLRELRPKRLDSGHLSVRIPINGKTTQERVHRLVLLAFVGPCPEGMECRHFPDRDPTNNALSNLSWGTRLQNQRDRYVQGTDQFGTRNHQAKLDEDRVSRIRVLYSTGKYLQKDLAAMFGMSRRGIGRIVRGERWAQVSGPVADYSHRKYRFNSETAIAARRCQETT